MVFVLSTRPVKMLPTKSILGPSCQLCHSPPLHVSWPRSSALCSEVPQCTRTCCRQALCSCGGVAGQGVEPDGFLAKFFAEVVASWLKATRLSFEWCGQQVE